MYMCFFVNFFDNSKYVLVDGAYAPTNRIKFLGNKLLLSGNIWKPLPNENIKIKLWTPPFSLPSLSFLRPPPPPRSGPSGPSHLLSSIEIGWGTLPMYVSRVVVVGL